MCLRRRLEPFVTGGAEMVSKIFKDSGLVVFGKCVPFNQVEYEGKTNLSCKRGEKVH